MRRTRTTAAGAALAALALAGCSSLDGGADEGGGGDGTHSSTVTAAYSIAPGSPNRAIDRITGAQNVGSQIAMALCEPPTGIDEEGTVFMRGAESVESQDQKTWTITLADRTFSDGTPITAQTYADTWNFVATGASAMPSNYAFTDIEGYDELNPAEGQEASATELSGLKVVDDRTLTLTMKRPFNDVPYLISQTPYCPMPSSAFADMTAYDRNPVSNGAYTLVKLDPQVEAVLERDENYKGWVPDGAAERLVFKLFLDANTAYQDVVAGNTDVLRSLQPALVAQAKNALGDQGLTAIDKHTVESYITWPTYLHDQFPTEVREALSMVINRDAISENLFLGSSLAAHSLMPDSVGAYREDPCGEPCSFDPAKAKTKLAEAGFTGTIPLLYNSENNSDASTALAISNEAKKIGLTVEPTPVPSAQLSEQTNTYALTGPRIAGWGSAFPSASEWIASIMVDANYRLKYTNQTASDEIAAAWASTDEAEGDRHWQAAEDSILADQVMTPVYYQVMYIAHDPCLTPHSAAGDMQIYRTEITCEVKD